MIGQVGAKGMGLKNPILYLVVISVLLVLILICGSISTFNSGYTKTTQVSPYTLVMVPTTSIVNSSGNTNPGGGYDSVSANDQLAMAISHSIDYTNPIVLDFARNQIQTSMQEHIISRRYAMFGKQYTIDGRMFEEFPHSMMLYRQAE